MVEVNLINHLENVFDSNGFLDEIKKQSPQEIS